MGADLYMNPPAPPSFTMLVSPDFGAVAIYRYPGEMENTSRVWHRVYFLSVDSPASAKEAAALTAKASGTHVQEVDSDAVMQQTIHPDVMRDLLSRRSHRAELDRLTAAFDALGREDQLQRNMVGVDVFRSAENLLVKAQGDQRLCDDIKNLQNRVGREIFGFGKDVK